MPNIWGTLGKFFKNLYININELINKYLTSTFFCYSMGIRHVSVYVWL